MNHLRILCVALICLAGVVGVAAQTPVRQPPPKKRAKPPEEPIDPNATAGVREAGFALTVRVTLKGNGVTGAFVVAKNSDGSVAGTCSTAEAGDCILAVGAGDYVIRAKQNKYAGAVSMHVTASRLVIVKLLRAASSAPSAR